MSSASVSYIDIEFGIFVRVYESFSQFNVAEEARVYLGKISADLDRTVDFWLKNSHDDKNG